MNTEEGNNSVSFRLLRWLPVVFVAVLKAWSYYAYVVLLCLCTVENVTERVFYLLIFHAILPMLLWAYCQTIYTKIGTVPPQFKPSPGDASVYEARPTELFQRHLLENFAEDLPLACRAPNGSVRYCVKCHNIKPDRAHHCSVCGVCVLKMDHHCHFMNNCVSFTNYKFFILALGYASLHYLFLAATSLQYCIGFWTRGDESLESYNIIFLFFVSFALGGVLLILFSYHIHLVSKNRSTLEAFEPALFRTGPDKNGFNVGRRANFIQIFGEDARKWFLPVRSSSGDGVQFPTRVPNCCFYSSEGDAARFLTPREFLSTGQSCA